MSQWKSGRAIPPGMEPVKEYIYLDENGQRHSMVKRYLFPDGHKEFRQAHWDDFDRQQGIWVSTKPDTYIPYHLNRLAAADPCVDVHICEGEKDADSLCALGLLATTNPGGCENWNTCLNPWFKGRKRVFIHQDNDQSGRELSDEVARALAPDVGEVRIVRYPDVKETGDVTDWLNDGHTKQQLLERCEATPLFNPAAMAQAQSDVQPLPFIRHGDPIPPMAWLIRNRLPEVGAGLLAGQWGTYKTFVALDMAASVMTGWDWTGEQVYRRGGVLFFAPEGSGGLGLRVAALAEHKLAKDGREVPFDLKRMPFIWTTTAPVLLGKDALAIMLATANAVAQIFQADFDLPLALIVIDTLSASAGWQDENNNAEAARAMALLHSLSQATGCAVVGIDHAGKNLELGTRGASAKEANSDFVLATLGEKKLTGEVENTRLAMRKLRDGPQGMEFPYEAPDVDMDNDARGNPIRSKIIVWGVAPKAKKTPVLDDKARAFDTALSSALKAHGKEMQIDGVDRYAVAREHVREAFRPLWKPEEGLKRTALDQRFRVALTQARDAYRIDQAEIEKIEWIWRVPAL